MSLQSPIRRQMKEERLLVEKKRIIDEVKRWENNKWRKGRKVMLADEGGRKDVGPRSVGEEERNARRVGGKKIDDSRDGNTGTFSSLQGSICTVPLYVQR
ncbi:hypothetical protein K504DRAFT_84512 [Pleomassaria siparia CBS 279.74]|uniref:Uncharacterized protein n=1 Tax=Pleomassaria siparia CBS 279.74 TaxID=1314801 RepID=A0A6G1JZN8_9PLEO|nr:hypothetical protein K504DRAFT_84512 [Pleomassaria siparia CBS 279.74]